MNNNLFQPSLKEDYAGVEDVYEVNRLFLVAFFGGTIPLMALCWENGRILRTEKKVLLGLMAAGLVILISKFTVATMIFSGGLVIAQRTLKLGYRIASVLLFLGFKVGMNREYNQHLLLGGGLRPILKDAVMWIFIGTAIEVGILLVLSELVK